MSCQEESGQNVAQERQDLDHDGIIGVDEVVATYIIGPRGTEGKITGDQEAPEFRWYITDGLGSVIAEVGAPDANGNPVKATRRYDVYGAVRSSTGTGAKQQFCGSLGHTADDDTGLTYMRARYYDPAIGRFVSEDPARDGVNWYAYCWNSPTNGFDATGKEFSLSGSLVSAGIGGVLNCVVNGWDWQNLLSGIATGFLCTAAAGWAYGSLGPAASAAQKSLALWKASGAGALVGAISNMASAWLGGNRELGDVVAAGIFGAIGGGLNGMSAPSRLTQSLTYWTAQVTLGVMVADGQLYATEF